MAAMREAETSLAFPRVGGADVPRHPRSSTPPFGPREDSLLVTDMAVQDFTEREKNSIRVFKRPKVVSPEAAFFKKMLFLSGQIDLKDNLLENVLQLKIWRLMFSTQNSLRLSPHLR